MSEMVALSIVGVSLATFVVYVLATRLSLSSERAIVKASLEDVTPVILDAAFPLSASEVVTGSLGEATAGIVAAGSSLVTSTLLNTIMEVGKRDDSSSVVQVDDTKMEQSSLTRMQQQQQQLQSRDLSRQALADGDFFVTRATVGTLFESMGMAPSLAVLG
eukprot:CAMPEP_0168785042 /NCGR_PEP_ID=MMETSP0725-20121227/10538_1 /TAXON_ID=265536 /ORGANISM="Amphiprora sp., Strain CCMP467" /LENGTH=160 /DNA_ID=CAMNT_0008835119 /DNA_START=237 /DNA_END=716 /DNA_ORIENTATION=+